MPPRRPPPRGHGAALGQVRGTVAADAPRRLLARWAGVTVDGQRIKPNDAAALKEGSKFILGAAPLQYVVRGLAAPAAAPAKRGRPPKGEMVDKYDILALAFSGNLEGGKLEAPHKLHNDKQAFAQAVLAKWPAGVESILA